MAEFFNDQHREAYISGLEHEQEGYEAKIAAAEAEDDKIGVARYKRRIAQITAELERLGEVEAKPKPKRGSKKAAAAEAGDDETPGEPGAEDEDAS